jgi:hypothetical protein
MSDSCAFCRGVLPDAAQFCPSCGSQVTITKGREAGSPTGRLEGRILHVSHPQVGGKEQAGASGPQSEHGYVGAVSTKGTAPHASGFGSKSGSEGNAAIHWHRRPDGSIKRDVPMPDEQVEHIFELAAEHITPGSLARFKDAEYGNIWGIVIDCGSNGILVRDGENRAIGVYFDEIEEVRPVFTIARKPHETV